MTESQKILEMIENVSPVDTDTLDEIDARVWCYVRNQKLEDYHNYVGEFEIGSEWKKVRYTRSRDALKSIRPEGWSLSVAHTQYATLWLLNEIGEFDHHIQSPKLPTEELAELHVIIQAIEWERQMTSKYDYKAALSEVPEQFIPFVCADYLKAHRKVIQSALKLAERMQNLDIEGSHPAIDIEVEDE